MTPKEKAKELVDNFTFIDNGEKLQLVTTKDKIKAKQCALICVEPMIYFIESHNNEWYGWAEDLEFWQEVQHEIEKL